MAISKATAQEMLDLWLKADKAVALNQEYKIGDRTYTRADADVITEKITYYSDIVDSYTPKRSRVSRVVY
ncbi:MAG: DUF6148 family protein [Deferribacterales bacterium]